MEFGAARERSGRRGSWADVTDPTSYDYDHPPVPGRERGTYAITTTGSVGPGCIAVVIGTAKFLPNAERTGGMVCAKLNVELRGTVMSPRPRKGR